MTLSFTLSQLGPGKNAILTTRKGQRYPSPQYTAWEKQSWVEVLEQLGRIGPISRHHVALDIVYSPRDQRKHDFDNICSPLLHFLVAVGILFDDCQVTQVKFVTMPPGMPYALSVEVRDE